MMIDEIEAVRRFRSEIAPPSATTRAAARQVLDRATAAEPHHRYARSMPRPAPTARTKRAWMLVAAAAIVVLGLFLAGPTSPLNGGGGGTSSANAELRNAILTAYDSTAGDILWVHQTMTASNGTATTADHWSMLSAGFAQPEQQVRSRFLLASASGTPIQDFQLTYLIPLRPRGTPFSPRGDVIDVDYPTRTWSHQTDAQAPPARFDTEDVVAVGSLQSWIASGHFSQTGTTTFDGQPVIELSQNDPPAGTSLVAWVSETTHLPVHEVFTSTMGHGPAAVHGVILSDLSYLPATTANLANLQVTIPAGFTQTATPPGP
jgi:hypothetical protein